MKKTYKVFYWFCSIFAITTLLGGTVTLPLFSSVSKYTLETIGVKKIIFTSADDKIDELYFSVDKIQLQIDKLKNIFSSESVDETKYQKTKHEILNRNIYEPVLAVVIYFYRLLMFLIAIAVLFTAIILNIIYSKMDLRRRIESLEAEIIKLKAA